MTRELFVKLEKCDFPLGIHSMDDEGIDTKTTFLNEKPIQIKCENVVPLTKSPLTFKCVFSDTLNGWKLKEVSVKENELESLVNNEKIQQELDSIKNKLNLYFIYNNFETDTNPSQVIYQDKLVDPHTLIKKCSVRLKRFSLSHIETNSNSYILNHERKRPRSCDNIEYTTEEVSIKKYKPSEDIVNVELIKQSVKEVTKKCESKVVKDITIGPKRLTRGNYKEYFGIETKETEENKSHSVKIFPRKAENKLDVKDASRSVSVKEDGDSASVQSENSLSCSSGTSDKFHTREKWKIVKKGDGDSNRIILMKESFVQKMISNSQKCCKELTTETYNECKTSEHLIDIVGGSKIKMNQPVKDELNEVCVLGETFFKDFISLLKKEMHKHNDLKIKMKNAAEILKYKDQVKTCKVIINRSQLVEDLVTNRGMWKHDKDVIVDIPNVVLNKIGKARKICGKRLKKKHHRGRIPFISRKNVKCYAVNRNKESISQCNENSDESKSKEFTGEKNVSKLLDTEAQANDLKGVQYKNTNIVEIDYDTILSLIDFNMGMRINSNTILQVNSTKSNSLDSQLTNNDKTFPDLIVDTVVKQSENTNKDIECNKENKLEETSSLESSTSHHVDAKNSISDCNGVLSYKQNSTSESISIESTNTSSSTTAENICHDSQVIPIHNSNKTDLYNGIDFNEIVVDNTVPVENCIIPVNFTIKKHSRKRKRHGNKKARKKSSKSLKDFVQIVTAAIVHANEDSQPVKKYISNNSHDVNGKCANISESIDQKIADENVNPSSKVIVEKNNNVKVVKMTVVNKQDSSKCSNGVENINNHCNTSKQGDVCQSSNQSANNRCTVNSNNVSDLKIIIKGAKTYANITNNKYRVRKRCKKRRKRRCR